MALDPAIAAIIAQAAERYGQDPSYLQRQAIIESGGRPGAQNPNSSAGGLFQFIDSTAKDYGLSNKFDPVAASDAAARLARDNGAVLAKALGRAPTPGELYLAHQQGSGGARGLLTNPDAPAASIVGRKAVLGNGGSPNDTAAQFASRWVSKFDGAGTPTMTMPAEAGGRAVSARLGLSGAEAAAASSPVMAMPNAPQPSPPATQPDPNTITAADLMKMLAAPAQVASQTMPPAASQAPPIQPLDPAPPPPTFDAARFFALLQQRR